MNDPREGPLEAQGRVETRVAVMSSAASPGGAPAAESPQEIPVGVWPCSKSTQGLGLLSWEPGASAQEEADHGQADHSQGQEGVAVRGRVEKER